MDKKEKITLEIKFNDKVYAVFLDDFRIGGCKWNDVDGGKVINVSINKADLLERLKKLDNRVYDNALTMACEVIDQLNDFCKYCTFEYADECDQDCVGWRKRYFLEQAEKEIKENETNNKK